MKIKQEVLHGIIFLCLLFLFCTNIYTIKLLRNSVKISDYYENKSMTRYEEIKELTKEINFQNKRLDHFKMYYAACFNTEYVDINKYPTGIYYEKFIYIWLENRTYIDALETFNHEWLHYKNRGHFIK